ncbi:MAG TPA: sigma-70 family RNA polymerase sigma factor [Solirubrobacteraceae bacterium]|nr:sigma-70 family RNA polymerase sigma factor [Solirubrobacteraceae bacterium]
MEAASVHAPAGLHRVSVPLLRLRSDDQLLALFRKGEEDAFQVIHERYRQRLFAYARQMLGGSRSDAEDAMQDVFLRAYGALRADDRPVTLRAWLYRVAHNRCIDQLRRPLPAVADLFDLTRGPSLHDPLEEAERREDLRRLVADVRRLPEQQRSALLMREMEGLSYKELSEALAVSIPAVKSLLVRARIGLVEAIEARDAACCDIRLDIAAAVDRGVRASGRARRHMRECASCREYRTAMRGELKQLNGMSGGNGLLATAAKLLGLGGAGSGAAAGAGGAGGAAVVGGSAVATKVAVLACCAAVVGGTVEVQQAAQPAKHPAPHPVAHHVAVAAPLAVAHVVDKLVAPAHQPKPVEEVTRDAAPADATPVVADITPASDSPVVDQSNGGMLAPDDDNTAAATTDPTAAAPVTTPASGTSTGTSSSAATTTPTSTTTDGAKGGPDGDVTGSAPPTAQGATTPGVTKTPS